MKRKFNQFLLLVGLGIATFSVGAETIDLSGSWKLEGLDEYGKAIECAVSVPGDVQSALLSAGKMCDPFWGWDETRTQWVGRRDWTISRTFEADGGVLSRKAVVLRLDDVDTFATIFVNDHEVGHTDNRFRRWEFDLKPFLKEGRNEIRAEFESPERKAKEIAATYPYGYYMSCNVYRWASDLSVVRKPACHGGWDWGLAQMVVGLCGEVRIFAYDDFKVDYIFDDQVFTADYSHCDLTVNVVCTDAAGKSFVERKTMAIDNPKLWWPNGEGEQNLLDVAVEVRGRQIRWRTGLRKIELVTDRDADGKGSRFVFRVNGREIFAKGADWIPCDAFENRQTPARYRDLIESAAAANMNMLRVWGGGLYEKDCFYDICDEKGILVWQDFMFSCATYPNEAKFNASIAEEVRHQVRRLRGHPSLALWCGDNECIGAIRWAAQEWDVYGVTNEPVHERNRKDLADRMALIDGIVRELDPTRVFWPSSPCAGPGNFANNWVNDKEGDLHSWDVWGGCLDFTEYLKLRPRFVSEYGFQSYPAAEVVATFAHPWQRGVRDPKFMWHQKNMGGNDRILKTMTRLFAPPRNETEASYYLSQVQQALALKTAAEGWHAMRPRCMGVLYWQLNDLWPVASWSTIDYGGKWKHAQYQAKRFFAPVSVSPTYIDDRIVAINDTAADRDAEIVVETWRFNAATPEKVERLDRKLPAGHVTELGVWSGDKKSFLLLRLKTSRGEIQNERFFGPFVGCELGRPRVKAEIDGFKVTLSTDKPAFFVWANAAHCRGEFDDNSFTLLPGNPKTLVFTPKSAEVTPELFRRAFSVTHLAEACK